MLLKRIYDTTLAQASYLVGCQATGEALVIDPNRDVEQYLRAAADEGLRVTHVTETHIHADFVSGARELAERAGARLLLSAEGGRDWQYAFASDAGATLLHHGDRFMVGNLKLDVLHTPGHTPEHLTFLVTDTPATDRPMAAFTGDFIFVGDVGRPDLLEKAAKVIGTMDDAARTLFHSLRRFVAGQPDYLQLFPGHGAGSACGKALGAVPSTTLGYEKIANWGLTTTDEEEFVRTVLDGQPEPPDYFAEMKRVNRAGPARLGGLPHPPRLTFDDLLSRVARGEAIVDTRPAARFAGAHVPGTINIPLGRSFSTWAGSLLSYDRPFTLIVEGGDGGDAARALAMIGLDRLAGVYDASLVDAWKASGRAIATVKRVSAATLDRRMADGEVAVIDVRGQAEWVAGHLPGVPNIPLAALAHRLDELPRDVPIVVHCQSGARSAIAASLLHARGRTDSMDLEDGYAGWVRAGLPTVVEPRAVTATT